MTARSKSSFQTIKADILKKIHDRVWKPGETIPGEESFADAYGCSRVTVNRALRELAQEGLVERRRKSGTRVAQRPNRAARLEIQIVRQEIEAKGAAYRFALLECAEKEIPEAVRAKMSLSAQARGLHVRCVHFADETPYQYEDRWINLDRVPAARDESFDTVSPNEWLIEAEPYCEAEHIFSAQIADEKTAAILGISSGDPLFVVDRRTWVEDQTVTLVRLMFPGKSYRMISRGG